jgi:hypothetical protein
VNSARRASRWAPEVKGNQAGAYLEELEDLLLLLPMGVTRHEGAEPLELLHRGEGVHGGSWRGGMQGRVHGAAWPEGEGTGRRGSMRSRDKRAGSLLR